MTLYTKDATAAREAGEIELFRASHKENTEATKTLDELIRENSNGTRLDTEKVITSFIQKHGRERLALILAAHIAYRTWDGRFHKDVMNWAINHMNEYNEAFRKNAEERYYLNSHSVHIDAIAHDFIYYIQ